VTENLTTVTFEVAEHIATINLDRPAVMNAFNQPMLDDFRAVWHECRTNDEIRVVVLQANGERAFSTGVDRKEGRDRHPNPWSEDDPGQFLGAKQNRVWKPLICAVHGIAAGGAFYWLNEADVIICSDDATFFDPHTTYGMTSALEPVGLLGRIPFGEVMRLALFGLDERISAATALRIGLVSETVPVSELRPRARVLAERLAAKPPLAVQGTVKAIWDARHMSAHGQREIPLLYPQLANPMTKVELGAVEPPPYELR
jgi:enoyl-CoA hydratase/carnithine racemase